MTFKRLAEEARRAGIRVHVIAVDLEKDVKGRPGVQLLMAAVQAAGGRYFSEPDWTLPIAHGAPACPVGTALRRTRGHFYFTSTERVVALDIGRQQAYSYCDITPLKTWRFQMEAPPGTRRASTMG